jgi:hypothetical protein
MEASKAVAALTTVVLPSVSDAYSAATPTVWPAFSPVGSPPRFIRSSPPNPRRLPLPVESQLPTGTGRGGFLGVAYRSNRESRPWLARYRDHTLGSYTSAYEAALARWICCHFDRDVLERDGTWHGWAYGMEDGALTIKRFTDSTEEGVIQQIDRHLHIDRRTKDQPGGSEVGGGTDAVAGGSPPVVCGSLANNQDLQTTLIDPPLPPANPRRGALPTELPRTACRGQYRGVVYDKGRYAVRWRKQYLGSHNTAFEAGLTWYIAEHFDRDIEPDEKHGFRARAYKQFAGGQRGHVEVFYAESEAEAIRLVDKYHGVVRPRPSTEEIAAHSSFSPSLGSHAVLCPMEDAIHQYVDHLWLRYSVRGGQAVCEELYMGWLLFLSQRRLSHLVRIEQRKWQDVVEKLLRMIPLRVPIFEDEQAMSLPADCLVPRARKVFRLQWEMVMTSMCTPEVCVAVWKKRRRAAAHRSVYVRQAGIADEVRGRALLKARFPLWDDDWTAPTPLSEEELRETAEQEAHALSLDDLEHLAATEPDNVAARRELRRRKKQL